MRRSLVPDIANLQAFECAARHGNFTRAAEELSLTQSAISRQIRDLELQTGLLLFERVRQRVILSEAGLRFLPEVRRLISQSEQLMIRAVAAADKDEALSIATLPTFGSRWLMPRLPKFLAERPSVELTIESRAEPFDFDEEGFDLAIHYGKPTWAKATSTFLCSEIVLPIASAALLRDIDAKSPADLIDAPLLHLTTRPRLWQQWFEANGASTDRGFRGNRFDQFSMMIGAVQADMGVALLPSYLIEDDIRAGTLIPIFDLPMATEFSYYVVLPENRQHNVVANAFKDWLLGQVSRPKHHQAEADGGAQAVHHVDTALKLIAAGDQGRVLERAAQARTETDVNQFTAVGDQVTKTGGKLPWGDLRRGRHCRCVLQFGIKAVRRERHAVLELFGAKGYRQRQAREAPVL